MLSRLLFVLFFTGSIFLQGQHFSIQQFRAEDGLVTDLIKCVAQDSLGFIWIGTDEGLLKYDGVKFTQYPEAASSRYFKDFLTTHDGKLLAVHDLGVIQIRSTTDSVHFEELIEGTQINEMGKLWYPKLAYEDVRNNLWIAEPQSIVRIENQELKRYDFGPEDNSASFVRSFHFVNISPDSVLISSYPGNFFLYDYAQDSLMTIRNPIEELQVFVLKKVNGKIYLGGNDGLYEVALNRTQLSLKSLNIRSIVTDLVPLSRHSLLVCAEDNRSMVLEYDETGNSSAIPIEVNVSINQAYKGSDNVIWLSTLRGLYLLRASDFRAVDLKQARTFIEGVYTTEFSDYIYVLSKEFLWKVNKKNEQVVSQLHYPNGYFLTGSMDKDNMLWVSNEFSLWTYHNNRYEFRRDFSDCGRYIFDVHTSDDYSIWLIQEAAAGITRYFPDGDSIRRYLPEETLSFTAIEGNNEVIYFGTNDSDNYLYQFDRGANKLLNRSHLNMLNNRSGFLVNDLEIMGDTLVLATNKGILIHSEDSVYRLSFNTTLDNIPILSLAHHNQNLWLGSSIGLFKYDLKTGDNAQFNERLGMPINSVTEEGIVIDDDKVWIGTTYGLTVSNQGLDYMDQTPKPHILSILVNGQLNESSDRIDHIPNQSLVELNYASMVFPANEIQYSYRIGSKSNWSEPSFSNSFQLAELSSGTHLVEIRAKKLGKYHWSDPTQVILHVNAPFYLTLYFYLLIAVGVLLITLLTRHITRRIMIRRQEVLKELVDNRTMELKTYKENLEDLIKERTQELKETQSQLIQAEKMASLGTLTAGVAHEINNPVNYLQAGLYSLETIFADSGILKSDTEIESTIEEVTQNMQFGVDRIAKIVSSLGRFSRKGNMEKTPCNIHEILDNCLLILAHETKDRCKIIKHYDPQLPNIEGDESSLHQLFTNLISNASQAIEKEGVIEITTRYKGDTLIITVEDDGIGIDEDQLGKLFDPFFTTKPPGMGTGLGLYLSHKVAEEHKATLTFESKPGQGTKVVCTFIIFNKDARD